VDSSKRIESSGNLQHISEREPDDWEEDPSLHPTTETMFMEKSKQSIRLEAVNYSSLEKFTLRPGLRIGSAFFELLNQRWNF
jgi:hypothetical protein